MAAETSEIGSKIGAKICAKISAKIDRQKRPFGLPNGPSKYDNHWNPRLNNEARLTRKMEAGLTRKTEAGLTREMVNLSSEFWCRFVTHLPNKSAEIPPIFPKFPIIFFRNCPIIFSELSYKIICFGIKKLFVWQKMKVFIEKMKVYSKNESI